MHVNSLIRVGTILLLTLPAYVSAEDRPAAKIDDEVISTAEVNREFTRALGVRKLTPAVQTALREATVRKLVDRRLVFRNLAHLGRAASEDDIRQTAVRVEAKLKADGSSVADFLAREKLTKDEWRREIAWQLTWGSYLDEKCNDDNLQKFFERNRPHYDGRERKVAHILWKTTPAMSAAEREKLAEQARSVRAEIAAEKVTFAEAAKLHSQSPTAANGGDLGWISRHDPMPEDFSRAAFDLKAGEVSQPVRTSFGWHLAQFSEERPGKVAWQDIREELRGAVTSYLFDFHAGQERERNSPRIEISPP